MSENIEKFVWGVSTAAYQIEGAWLEGGKGLSIWDAFAHTPGKIFGGHNADISCNHYNLFEEDIELLKDLGVGAYRLSISWPRIMPQGTGEVNKQGIEFYSKLIDSLLENNIEPWVTLYHWDLPLVLSLENDGWLNSGIADQFANYAKVCFNAFGDRVKNWITLNEPWVVANLGYGKGEFAPGRTSNTELYIAAHNLLRAHGKAAKIYREEFKPNQNGVIGIANNCDWREPKTNSNEDIQASERALEFLLGWFADPLYKGDYPESMKQNIGSRLPKFSDEDRELVKDSVDFFGLNHYSTMYAENDPKSIHTNSPYANGGISEDERVFYTSDDNWKKTEMGWNVVPWGFSKLLNWIDKRYNKPIIYITENGSAFKDTLVDGVINDQDRLEYLRSYIAEMKKCISSGIKIKGYFVWSLMDNFEWAMGFSKRFGLYYTNYETLERIQKESAKWYKSFIKNL